MQNTIERLAPQTILKRQNLHPLTRLRLDLMTFALLARHSDQLTFALSARRSDELS